MSVLERVRSHSAVDLADDEQLAGHRRQRKLAEHAPDVKLEVERLQHRAASLRAKAQRLPVRSNGRKQAEAEAGACDMMVQLLATALVGQRTPQLQFAGARHVERAVRLLHALQQP